MEESKVEEVKERNQEVPHEVGLDSDNNEARIFLSYQQADPSPPPSTTKTPGPSRGPPSRMSGQEIDIDQLIAKLLLIPNDELLDSILNLNDEEVGSRHHDLEDQQSEECEAHHNFSSEDGGLPSGLSSGLLTPHA
jgi:hypothetical protein